MQKVILIFGLLAGAIISLLMILGFISWGNDVSTLEFSEYIGYASMVIALSMVFFGIKSYRDNYRNGSIGYWKAFQVGILITLIASLMYAITWETYCQARPAKVAAFLQLHTETTINKIRDQGASAAEINQKIKDMDKMMTMYQNPLFRFLFTLMEILPVGIIITLISAALLKRDELLPPEYQKQDAPQLGT